MAFRGNIQSCERKHHQRELYRRLFSNSDIIVSSLNAVSLNTITDNKEVGVWIQESNQNDIRENSISGAKIGIDVRSSEFSEVFREHVFGECYFKQQTGNRHPILP